MRFLSALVPATLAILVAGPALADGKLTVSGIGIARSAPDMATITTGVTTQSATAREALDANTEAMNELIAVLREAGLESRDIQTTDFTVSPQYVYSDQRDESGFSLPPQIAGYQVSNAVSIAVRDLDNLGSVLDRAISVGANTINGIAFSVENPTELLAEARRNAVSEARAKAETYADAAGVTLGSIDIISEQDGYIPPQPVLQAARAEVAFDNAVPVEAGESTYSVTVTITWELED